MNYPKRTLLYPGLYFLDPFLNPIFLGEDWKVLTPCQEDRWRQASSKKFATRKWPFPHNCAAIFYWLYRVWLDLTGLLSKELGLFKPLLKTDFVDCLGRHLAVETWSFWMDLNNMATKKLFPSTEITLFWFFFALTGSWWHGTNCWEEPCKVSNWLGWALGPESVYSTDQGRGEQNEGVGRESRKVQNLWGEALVPFFFSTIFFFQLDAELLSHHRKCFGSNDTQDLLS